MRKGGSELVSGPQTGVYWNPLESLLKHRLLDQPPAMSCCFIRSGMKLDSVHLEAEASGPGTTL